MEGETKPEGRAEDSVGVKRSSAAGGYGDGYEHADDGADGGNGEAGGEGANHPSAVEGDFAAADVPKGFAEGEEEERAKERGCDGLREAADGGHGEAHDERGNANRRSTEQKDPTGDAVPLRVLRAERGIELERPQDHKEDAGQDMGKGEVRMTRKDVINTSESRGYRIGRRCRGLIAMEDYRQNVDDAASGYGDADECEENDGGPEQSGQ